MPTITAQSTGLNNKLPDKKNHLIIFYEKNYLGSRKNGKITGHGGNSGPIYEVLSVGIREELFQKMNEMILARQKSKNPEQSKGYNFTTVFVGAEASGLRNYALYEKVPVPESEKALVLDAVNKGHPFTNGFDSEKNGSDGIMTK
jgi:hypothetical protein